MPARPTHARLRQRSSRLLALLLLAATLGLPSAGSAHPPSEGPGEGVEAPSVPSSDDEDAGAPPLPVYGTFFSPSPLLWVAVGLIALCVGLPLLGHALRRRLTPLGRRLNARALHMEPWTPRTWHGLRLHQLVCVPVLVVVAIAGASTGLTEEQVGPMNLYPARYFFHEHDTTLDTPRVADCREGTFSQRSRPLFGLCVGNDRLPFLFSAYITTVTYWPLRWVGQLLPDHPALLGYWTPLALFLVLLVLWSAQAARHGGLTTAAASVSFLLLFPMAACGYRLPFLFEVLPTLLLFVVWRLLDAWNTGGKSAPLLLAALCVGLATMQKLPTVLTLFAFLAAYVVVLGLRRLTLRRWQLAFALATLPLLFYLLAAHTMAVVHDMHSLLPSLVAGETRAIPWLVVPNLVARMLVGTPTLGSVPTGFTVHLAVLIVLLGYGVYALVRHLRSATRERPVAAMMALTIFFSLGGWALVYPRNPGSMPILQLAPIVCLLAAELFRDAVTAVRRLARDRIPRWAAAAALLAALAGVGVYRWAGYYDNMFYTLGWPIYRDQEQLAAALLERGIREPVRLQSFENAVYEFLTGGAFYPRYVYPDEGFPIEPPHWQRILELTRSEETDFLFTTRGIGAHENTARYNRDALAHLRTALATSSRAVQTEEELAGGSGQRTLLWIRVGPAEPVLAR